MHITEYSLVALRALEYWERGHRRTTKLRRRILRELTRRQCSPWKEHMTDTLIGQVPGLKGAAAALRCEQSGGIVRGNARPSRGLNG